MAKSFIKSYDLTSAVYLTARQQVLRSLSKSIGQLDALYAQDAEKLKTQLGRMFKLSGFSQARVSKMIDDVLAASRKERVEIVRSAIEDAARKGRTLDKATFDAVFGKDPDVPKGKGRSGLRLIGTPSQSPANGSEDESSSSG